MSYTIDVFRKRIEPTKKFADVALFVAFFPQLLAGPIEKAARLLPQISKPRTIDANCIYEGLYLILWGLYLKIFVADNMALLVNPVFAGTAPYNGIKVYIALIAIGFQIYGDFAGYSNIARGLGKLMGFNIINNFNLPLFSKNPQDMMQRWHISFVIWIKDYVFYSILFSLKTGSLKFKAFLSLIITMFLVGLWHGAAWNFVLCGLYYGFVIAVYFIIKNKVKPEKFIGKNIWLVVRIILMGFIAIIGCVFFRSESLTQMAEIFKALVFNFTYSDSLGLDIMIFNLLLFGTVLVVTEFIQYFKKDLLIVLKLNPFIQLSFYIVIIISIFLLGPESSETFIYFQF